MKTINFVPSSLHNNNLHTRHIYEYVNLLIHLICGNVLRMLSLLIPSFPYSRHERFQVTCNIISTFRFLVLLPLLISCLILLSCSHKTFCLNRKLKTFFSDDFMLILDYCVMNQRYGSKKWNEISILPSVVVFWMSFVNSICEFNWAIIIIRKTYQYEYVWETDSTDLLYMSRTRSLRGILLSIWQNDLWENVGSMCRRRHHIA